MGNLLGRDEMFWRLGHEKSEQLLEDLRKVENVNFQDEEGTSYLHVACINHYAEAVKVLLEMGADPNISDNMGFTPISDVIGRAFDNNAEILELLLSYGLDINKQEGYREGDMIVKDLIRSFEDEEYNTILDKYDNK